jgi:hypothetical protein
MHEERYSLLPSLGHLYPNATIKFKVHLPSPAPSTMLSHGLSADTVLFRHLTAFAAREGTIRIDRCFATIHHLFEHPGEGGS